MVRGQPLLLVLLVRCGGGWQLLVVACAGASDEGLHDGCLEFGSGRHRCVHILPIIVITVLLVIRILSCCLTVKTQLGVVANSKLRADI